MPMGTGLTLEDESNRRWVAAQSDTSPLPGLPAKTCSFCKTGGRTKYSSTTAAAKKPGITTVDHRNEPAGMIFPGRQSNFSQRNHVPGGNREQRADQQHEQSVPEECGRIGRSRAVGRHGRFCLALEYIMVPHGDVAPRVHPAIVRAAHNPLASHRCRCLR